MQVKTYIEFLYDDNSVIAREGYTSYTIEEIMVPIGFSKVRLTCRVEDAIIYKGKRLVLASRDVDSKTFDFSKFFNLSKKTRKIAIANEIRRIAYATDFDVKAEKKDEKYVPVHKVRYTSTGYQEFAKVKTYRVKSNRLFDIKIPNDCAKFSTFDILEQSVIINGKEQKMVSPELNRQDYLIGKQVDDGGLGDTIIVETKAGDKHFATREDVILSPNNIDEHGNIIT